MTRTKILIADDEADIALILKLQLEDAGYRTARVRDGVEALEMLASDRFELLLLDIKMPRMDGLQVLKKVKADYPEMVVVMMTAHGSEEIAVDAMKKGAVDYISKPFSNEDMLKRVERAISYNRTVLENERLQQELVAEQKKTEAILHGMAELLIAVDIEARIISVNRMAESLLGFKIDEILGKNIDEILDAELPAGCMLPCRTTLASGEPTLDVTYLLNTEDGKKTVLSSAAPLLNNMGVLIGSVEIIRDISSLKALEREREDFVSMLSHDLKNPITAIVGSLDLVREGRLGSINSEQREFIEAAQESCTEMVDMINSLLDIHKFEAGRMIMNYRSESPRHLLEKLLSQFSPVVKKSGIKLVFRAEETLPECRFDKTTFIRLVGNLISNALKFTPDNGEITITADYPDSLEPIIKGIPNGLYPDSMIPKRGEFLRIEVKDNGTGIPAESLSYIFDRFVQAQNRREGKNKGTGLGLAFCRKVMDAHHGVIWAESLEEQGSVFTALFPQHGEADSSGEGQN